MTDYVVSDNPAQRRYEITADGELAGYTVREPREDGVLVFPHTVVLDAFEGQGIAGRLVQAALDDVRAKGLTIVPECPYIQHWLGKHAEYADLVAPAE